MLNRGGEEHFSIKHPPPLCQVRHTQTHTCTHTHTRTARSHPMCAFEQTSQGKHKDAHMSPLPLSLTNTEHLFLFCTSKQTCFNMWTNPTILRPTLNPFGVNPGCFQLDNNNPQCDQPVLPPKDRLITHSNHSPWFRLWNLCKFVWEYSESREYYLRLVHFPNSLLLFPELSSTAFL